MSTYNLGDLVLEPGIRFTHFFNGRMLSGEALTQERTAYLSRNRQLGEAIGSGIAYGFEVSVGAGGTTTAPILSIAPGLAICASGQTIKTENSLNLAVVTPPSLDAAPDTDDFTDCTPLPSSVYINGIGYYLLTAAPAEGKEGSAPVSGLGNGLAPCNAKYIAQGLQLRLLPLQVTNPSDADHARNEIAYQCFAACGVLGPVAIDAYNNTPTSPSLSSLVPGDLLTEHDVPLAVLEWNASGLGFVDLWSVRRPITPRADPDDFLAALSASQRNAYPLVRQFYEHIQDLAKATIGSPATAHRPFTDFFTYLPPFGIVPLQGAGTQIGFFLADFFGSHASGTPTQLDDADFGGLWQRASACPPVKVADVEVLQLYYSRTNLQAQGNAQPSQLYAVFTTREAHGFLEADDVAITLGQTWKSYGTVLKKSILLPNPLDGESQVVWTALYSVQQNIINAAMARENLAAGRDLNEAGVLTIWQTLYDLQKELVQATILTFPNDGGLATRAQFGNLLLALLDGTTSAAAPTLLPSITAANLPATVAAQKRINTLVSSWSGEVAFGSVQIQHTGSPNGDSLVPGTATPFVYNYTITSRLDRTMTVALAATITGSNSGSWGGSVIIRNAAGSPITSLDLTPDQGIPVTIEVKVPGDAQTGQSIQLHVTSTIAPPTDKSWSVDYPLVTASGTTNAVVWSLNTTVVQLPPGRSSANPGQQYRFVFDTAFSANRAPFNANCTLKAQFTFQNSAAADWTLSIDGHSTDVTATASSLAYSFPLPATGNSGKQRTTFAVTAPAAAGSADKVASFLLHAETTVIDPQSGVSVPVTEDVATPFSVTLKQSS
jgi:hypothetical protein